VITLNLTVNSSLNDVVANAVDVSLYPNPANAYTILKVEGLKEQTPVYLFDIQGCKLKRVYHKSRSGDFVNRPRRFAERRLYRHVRQYDEEVDCEVSRKQEYYKAMKPQALLPKSNS